MPETTSAAVTVDTLLDRARGIAQMAAERRQAIQQQRHLPDDLVQALRESNLLRIMQPARWGGYEMDLGTFVRVATEIAKGDTSTGWVFGIGEQRKKRRDKPVRCSECKSRTVKT